MNYNKYTFTDNSTVRSWIWTFWKWAFELELDSEPIMAGKFFMWTYSYSLRICLGNLCLSVDRIDGEPMNRRLRLGE